MDEVPLLQPPLLTLDDQHCLPGDHGGSLSCSVSHAGLTSLGASETGLETKKRGRPPGLSAGGQTVSNEAIAEFLGRSWCIVPGTSVAGPETIERLAGVGADGVANMEVRGTDCQVIAEAPVGDNLHTTADNPDQPAIAIVGVDQARRAVGLVVSGWLLGRSVSRRWGRWGRWPLARTRRRSLLCVGQG